MTPILLIFFGINPTAAVSSDLVAAMVMKPVGGGVHIRRGTVRWEPACCSVSVFDPGRLRGRIFDANRNGESAIHDESADHSRKRQRNRCDAEKTPYSELRNGGA